MWLGIINLASGKYEMEALVSNYGTVTLPVLQDTSEAQVETDYGASKWYIYILDRQGVPRVIHYELDLDDDRQRLLDEIQAIAGESP